MQAPRGERPVGIVLGIIVIVVLVILLVAAAVLASRRAGGETEGVRGGGREDVRGRRRSPPAQEGEDGEDGEGGEVRIAWPTRAAECYSPAAIADMLHAVRAVPGFGPLTAEQHRTLRETAARLSRKHGVTLRTEQLVSIRNMEVALEAQRAGVRAMRHGRKIADDVGAGVPILEIAAKYNLPPLTVLKQALLEQKYSEKQVKAMIGAPATLPGRLGGEAPAVFAADLSSRLHADQAKAESQRYEDAVGSFLRAHGAQFKTEEDLRREQATTHGAPQLTPDFLFTSPLVIDNVRIWWLDAKNYPMYGGRIAAKSIARQAAKYTAAFGHGAMVFSGGLLCGAEVARKGEPQPLLLDGSFLSSP